MHEGLEAARPTMTASAAVAARIPPIPCWMACPCCSERSRSSPCSATAEHSRDKDPVLTEQRLVGTPSRSPPLSLPPPLPRDSLLCQALGGLAQGVSAGHACCGHVLECLS